jgi:cytidylate kinase
MRAHAAAADDTTSPMTLVAISASFGAGGTRIGPAVADHLGVPFLDRAIPLAVAARLDLEPEEAEAFDEQAGHSRLEQLLRGFMSAGAGVPLPTPPEALTTEDFRRATEEVLRRQAATGQGVILGRAAVVVLREDPRVLRVRLDGPRERRVEQAVALGRALNREAAERAVRRTDRTHTDYARHLYGADIRDPQLYHLMIDSTVLELDACVELIASAATSRVLASGPLT